MGKYCLIKTTFKNKSDAKKMAIMLLDYKLVACAQISTIDSFYVYNDKINKNNKEFLLSLKTKVSFYKKVENVITKNHQYEVPQIIMIPILSGLKSYFDWLEGCLK